MKRFALAAALLAFAAAGAAKADEITLRAPLAAAAVHEGDIDMSVYWTEVGTGYEVVATYAPRDAMEETGRLVMLLEEGEKVSFALPGEAQVIYAFARDNGAVQVRATNAWSVVATR